MRKRDPSGAHPLQGMCGLNSQLLSITSTSISLRNMVPGRSPHRGFAVLQALFLILKGVTAGPWRAGEEPEEWLGHASFLASLDEMGVSCCWQRILQGVWCPVPLFPGARGSLCLCSQGTAFLLVVFGKSCFSEPLQTSKANCHSGTKNTGVFSSRSGSQKSDPGLLGSNQGVSRTHSFLESGGEICFLIFRF